MPPLDLKKLRPGDKLRMKDGEKLETSGVYLSADGIIVRAKQSGNSIISRNCRLDDIEDHEQKGP